MEQVQIAIKELKGLRVGSISIGRLLTVENYLIPPTLFNFHHLYPAIKISVLGLLAERIWKRMLENELDIGIVFLPMKDQGNELETIPLYMEEMSFAVPKGHLLEDQKGLTLEVLKTTPSILLPENYYVRQLINKSCNDLGFSPQPIFEITTMESLINMVGKGVGVGVTILPKPYLENLNNNKIRVIPIINSNLTREVGIIYRKDKYMSAATRVFIEQLKVTAANLKYGTDKDND